MKRLAIIGLALCMALMLTAPAMALDVDFSGFYRVRGFCYHEYETFGSDRFFEEHSSDYLDMLLSVDIVFKVHPKLKLVTNFTALDKVWGEDDISGYDDVTQAFWDNPAARGEDTNNIDWNRAYMQFVTSIGFFRVGRIEGGAYGHDFLDTTVNVDRFMWALLPKTMGGPSWNPLILAYVFEKGTEGDAGTGFSDEDTDSHFFDIEYLSQKLTIGNLFAFVRNETTTVTPFGSLNQAKQDVYFTNPYTTIKLGPVTIEGEARYTWGYITDHWKNTIAEGDVEIETWSWYMQATYDGGPFDAYMGWAHTDGDKDGGLDAVQPGDQTINSQSGQFGDDWDLLFFLTSDEGSHAATFGGMGNWSSAGSNSYGMDLLYIGGGFDITPTINIAGIWGWARADVVPTGSKQIGWETNITLTWQIMDGLQYKALFAFFDADGFWEDAQTYATRDVYVAPAGMVLNVGPPARSFADDGHCWALFHKLTLSF